MSEEEKAVLAAARKVIEEYERGGEQYLDHYIVYIPLEDALGGLQEALDALPPEVG